MGIDIRTFAALALLPAAVACGNAQPVYVNDEMNVQLQFVSDTHARLVHPERGTIDALYTAQRGPDGQLRSVSLTVDGHTERLRVDEDNGCLIPRRGEGRFCPR